MRTRSKLWALCALLCALLVGCGSDTDNTGPMTPSGAATATPSVTGTVTVFAAASLTESFTELGKQFEAAHPGVTVKFNFAASSALATQINQGAPADVFASASTTNMTTVVDAGNAADPKTFAQNKMAIVTPPDNPANIASVADLARPGVKVALCQVQVPCGAVAAKVFSNAGVTVTPKTYGADVKGVLTTVELGEVDGGVVYVTDAQAAGAKVKGIEIPKEQNASTSYPIAVLTKAPNSSAGQAFTEFVLSSTGQEVLAKAGFASPSS
ncbi:MULTISPECIES: molybdate ABC transporter substrate-binding protein [Protofrankia]|uniref:Molybdate-binding protein ModA n=1 Tax=Candidatus Protofrankia datiscae TaxID=2716812 RepID=F8B3E3_9ACTN|nr:MULTISPECIES: molybdate ABC transporter substrate-binding protein [Protofrankia]AEH08925.1 molybdenum ABC transporter, periplasmic molybdate-binding protein [Candidatus Protofrankia datiscae]